MTKYLPERRYTSSRENYWREMFNDFSAQEDDHSISGWSAQGLRLRIEAYCETLEGLDLRPGSYVLDLGCGAGVYSRLLDRWGFQVFSVDYACKVITKAKSRSGNGGAVFLVGDAYSLPFTDGVFDHIVCIGLFQSLERSQDVIGEIHRILKPGGVLCLMTLNRRAIKVTLDRLLGREEIIVVNEQASPRLNTYDPERFRGELVEAGFREIELRPVQIYPGRLNRLSRMLALWNRVPFLNYLTARSFIVSAVKSEWPT